MSGFPGHYNNAQCHIFYNFINNFWTYLFDSQLIIKKKYFYLGLLNLVYCSSQSDYTPETKAYERLFDKPNLQAHDDTVRYKNLFVNSMRLIEYVNTTCNALAGDEKIRFVMGGGKQYSLFQKALNKYFVTRGEPYFNYMFVNINPTSFAEFITELTHPNVKAAADADFGMFYPDGAIGATQCMAVCMLLQLSLKALFDNLLTATTYEIDIGNSCIGTPPTTLSSLREDIRQSDIYYPINDDVLQHIRSIINYFNTDNVTSKISPFDFVQKGSMVSYIKHIIHAVCDYIPQDYDDDAASHIASYLSSYCMITTQGFSSPLKGIFDIFYTLFIIENFTNRALVTQKINKELRRVAICAQVLYIHYRELLTIYTENAEQIDPMIAILTQMITYGYTQNISLMNQNNFQTIMTTYCQFVSCITNFVQNFATLLYYCINPPIPFNRALTSIETFFNSLLENSYNGATDSANPTNYPSKVLPPQIIAGTLMTVDQDHNFAAKITPCLHSINGVLTQLQEPAIVPYVTLLYNNKLYAACRDSKNKSEGIVAILSAYQSFLWDIRKRDRIYLNIGIEEHPVDLCQAEYSQLTQEAGLSTSYGLDTLNGLITSLDPCWAPGLNLLDLTEDNMLDGITFNAVNSVNDNKKKFLFFSWFITSIFGIKTKSKNTKVVSLGRTYLKLLMESHRDIRTILFGCNIIIPQNDEVIRLRLLPGQPNPGDTFFPCTDPNILCLAYNKFNVNDALTKYRETQDRLGNVGSGIESVKKIQLAPQVIGISFLSLVFTNELIGQLIGRFSKLPRGKKFIQLTADKMKFIMQRFLLNMTTTPANGENISFFYIVKHCMVDDIALTLEYTPHNHDILKFTDLPDIPEQCLGQFLRSKWAFFLVSNIINNFSVSTNIDDVTVKALFNYLRLFILLYKYLNITEVTLGGMQYTNRSHDKPMNSGLIQLVNLEVESVFTVNCIEETATAPPKPVIVPVVAAATGATVATASLSTRKLPPKQPVEKGVLEPAIKKETPPGVAAKAPSIVAAKARSGPAKAPAGGTICLRKPHSPKKTNNHTRRNKYKRNNKNKKHKSSPKYRKINPSSRSGSQSNRKKSKSKLPQKNVTFKRRRYNK